MRVLMGLAVLSSLGCAPKPAPSSPAAIERPVSDREAVVRGEVDGWMARSRAASALPDDRREALARDLTQLVTEVADASGVREVDFPAFVSDLVQGVFNAVVDATIKQMEAYADLLAEVSSSVDAFLEENLDQNEAREADAYGKAFLLVWSERVRAVLDEDDEDDD